MGAGHLSIKAAVYFFKWIFSCAVEARILEPPKKSNQKQFSLLNRTVILPPISRTLRFFKPIFVFLGGS